jgi:hypothetical protein
LAVIREAAWLGEILSSDEFGETQVGLLDRVWTQMSQLNMFMMRRKSGVWTRPIDEILDVLISLFGPLCALQDGRSTG